MDKNEQVAQMVSGLSAQMIDAFGTADSGYAWSADGRTVRALEKKGLVEQRGLSNRRLTPLGERVAAALKARKDQP